MREIRNKQLPEKPLVGSAEKDKLWSLCGACWEFDPACRITVFEALARLQCLFASSLITSTRTISLFEPTVVYVPEPIISQGLGQKVLTPEGTTSIQTKELPIISGKKKSAGRLVKKLRHNALEFFGNYITKSVVYDTSWSFSNSRSISSFIFITGSISSLSDTVSTRSLIQRLSSILGTRYDIIYSQNTITDTTVARTPLSLEISLLQSDPASVGDETKLETGNTMMSISTTAQSPNISQKALALCLIHYRLLCCVMIGIWFLLGHGQNLLAGRQWRDSSTSAASNSLIRLY